MKDVWADMRCKQGEILILKLIQELGLCKSHCLPMLVHGENVPILLNVKLGLYGDNCCKIPSLLLNQNEQEPCLLLNSRLHSYVWLFEVKKIM